MRSGAAESDSNPGNKYCYLRRVRLPFHSHPQMLSHSSFLDHGCFHSGHVQAGLLRPAAEISRKRRIRIKPGRLSAIKTNSYHRCSRLLRESLSGMRGQQRACSIDSTLE